MVKTKVKLNYDGFNKLRHDPTLTAALADIAAGVAESAGDGYESKVLDAETRNYAVVSTETPQAMREAEKTGGAELLRALRQKQGQ